MSFVGLY